MKIRNILYVIFMALFLVLAYFLIDRGINAKTKVVVNYKNTSDIIYKVYLKNDNPYNKTHLGMNEKYISSVVDYIDMEFNFEDLFSKNINGYYAYLVKAYLVAYTDDINDSLWTKEYELLTNKVKVINQNDVNNIGISDSVKIDYNEYREILTKANNDYHTNASGYLKVEFLMEENIGFDNIDKNVSEKKNISAIIPLSYDVFKINVINENNNVDSYYDFSKKEPVNYLLLIVGIFSLSIGISFLVLTFRNLITTSKNENKYNREIKKILREHDDIIVKVNKFYSKEMYNLIYVDSFKELMDVYKKVGTPISFKEVKRNSTAIFVITDDESAWIYEMNS